MEKSLFQNIDIDQENPLTPEAPASAFKFSLPKDPRIIALFIMCILILVLGVTAFITSAIRNRSPNTPPKTIPTPTISAMPTINNQNIPTAYINRFDQIDKEIQTEENFSPPQIDIDIGL